MFYEFIKTAKLFLLQNKNDLVSQYRSKMINLVKPNSSCLYLLMQIDNKNQIPSLFLPTMIGRQENSCNFKFQTLYAYPRSRDKQYLFTKFPFDNLVKENIK